jgi:hypothetical protein
VDKSFLEKWTLIMIYRFSFGIPMMVPFSFIWIHERRIFSVIILLAATALVSLGMFIHLFMVGKKEEPSMTIRATEIICLPTEFQFFKISLLMTFPPSLAIVFEGEPALALLFLSLAFVPGFFPYCGHIMLSKIGYFFYEFHTASGKGPYPVISKRALTKPGQLHEVRFLFHSLFFDVDSLAEDEDEEED